METPIPADHELLGIHMAQAFLGARPIFSLPSSTLPGCMVPAPRPGPSGGALQGSARTRRRGTGLGLCLCGDFCMAGGVPARDHSSPEGASLAGSGWLSSPVRPGRPCVSLDPTAHQQVLS